MEETLEHRYVEWMTIDVSCLFQRVDDFTHALAVYNQLERAILVEL